MEEFTMTAVFTALATSLDGYITGPDATPGQPLGVGGSVLFDWYSSGDTPSAAYPSFRLHPASARVFDAVADRTGAVIAGRKTYDDVHGWDGTGPHPSAALFVLSRRSAPETATPQQTFVASFDEALRLAAEAAGAKAIALMGSGPVAAALTAGLIDEVIVHQVPVLLGGGTRLFTSTSSRALHIHEVVTAPDVTHLTYRLER